MWKLTVGLFLFAWTFFSFTGSAEALRLKTSWGERVDLSEKIVRGQVISVRSCWNPGKTLIHTEVKVLVNEYPKGDGPMEIMLNIPGGTVYDKSQWVSDTPQFNVGDDDVIFLESSRQITGGPDGVYQLKGQDGDDFCSGCELISQAIRRFPKRGRYLPRDYSLSSRLWNIN